MAGLQVLIQQPHFIQKTRYFLFWSHTVWLNWRPPAEQ